MPKSTTPEEVFSLFNGEVQLYYKDSSHRYRASENGSKPESTPSVTTILNVLAKPALIEWGIMIACNYVEDNLRLLVSGDAFSVQQVFDVITRARTAHDRARDEAAEIGTSAHDWLAEYWRSKMTGVVPPFLPDEGKIRNCVDAALSWFGEHELRPLAIEEPQYSRIHKFCGRPDWIGHIDGTLSTLDYKSTKSIYPELCLQLTAYSKMHEEMTGELPATRWGLRLDKNTGEFEPKCYPPETFDLDWDTFLACFKIYDRLKHLRRKPKAEKKEDWLSQV